MRMTFSALLTGATAFLSLAPAQAQVSLSGRSLPLSVAVAAATEAISSCKANGYDVTATVVDVAGTPQVALRGDHATIHTRESSFRKAYTIITLGPIFHVDVTSEFVGHAFGISPSRGAGDREHVQRGGVARRSRLQGR